MWQRSSEEEFFSRISSNRGRGNVEYRGRGSVSYRGNRGGFPRDSSRGRGRAPQSGEEGSFSNGGGRGGEISRDSSRGRGRAPQSAEETNLNNLERVEAFLNPGPPSPWVEARGRSRRRPRNRQTRAGFNVAGPPGFGPQASRAVADTLAVDDAPIPEAGEMWQSWAELTVRIYDLQPAVTTWDLWKRFERHGTIVFIELFETRQGRREGTAKIRFRPPPNQDFWSSGTTTMPTPDGRGQVSIRIDREQKKRSFQLRSPIRNNVWYPETIASYPSAITFGFMYNETVMMNMRHVLDGWKDIKLDVDLLRSRLVVSFPTSVTGPLSNPPAATKAVKPKIYMFSIPFGQLQKIHRVELDETRWALLLSLDNPQQFFQKRRDMLTSHSRDALAWSETDTWFRVTDIVHDIGVVDSTAISLRKEPPFIDIGRWTTYYFSFDKDRDEHGVWEKMSMALADYNIDVIRMEKFSMVPGRPAAVWPLIDPPASDVHPKMAVREIAALQNVEYALPFEVRYQLEVCISQGVLQEHSITRDFVQNLSMMARADPASARSLLEYVADQETRLFDPMTIFKDPAARAHSPQSKIPEYCTYVRKLTVTPTMLYYGSPTVETSNRVVRRYTEHYGDRFLRVQFTDEKLQGRINSCADKNRNDKLFARVWRTLRNGIRIGDRTYEFLAFGNSQFRENGAYFFCPSPELTCADIRQWMGDFTDIKVIAKYAARLGLCFSTTRAINKTAVKIVKIRDVKKNGYCFTDGVGKVSEFLASTIAEELKLPPSSPAPSAFQFRLGGAKGVLTTWPDVKGREVHIRPSQDKFPSISNSLEIIRCSHYSPATLNRQTITILSSLGVPDAVFNDMMCEQLGAYQAAMKDRVVAQDCLGRYVDENHMTVTIASMIENGFMDVKEPFVMSLLHLWRAWSIKLLKEKARIIVENGAFLLGVTDESGTLRGQEKSTTPPGDPVKPEELPEIFVQVPDKNKKGCYVVIQGLCLVGRNPSLFPGDIRVVRAVNNPALHHLRDVVVFSQQGERDIPSMCSGGDLDGDDFFCIWDEELTPAEWNAVPMSYPAPKPMELDRPVVIEDVMKFFVRYMKNDALPTIAHSHLALSDFLDQGIKDPKCLELAQLHSKAVDYVKTGEPAEMPKRLRPRMWPQFMAKKHRPKEQLYSSQKILGQLYDRVDSVNFVPQFQSPFDERILEAFPLDDGILIVVKQLKGKYDTAVRQIMNQLGIKTEFEVWSTFVLSSRRVGTDYKLQEDMAVVTNALKDRFRKICIEAAGADGGNDLERLKPFVAAMYKVTAEEMRVALAECSGTKTVRGIEVPKRRMEPKYMPLMSFPWLFDGILGKIAKKAPSEAIPSIKGMLSLSTPSESKIPRPVEGQLVDVLPSETFEFPKLHDVKDYLDDAYLDETFTFAKSDSLGGQSGSVGPREIFGFSRPYSLEDCVDDVYLGQNIGLPRPDSPEVGSDGVGPAEDVGFAQSDSPELRSEGVGPTEEFGFSRPNSPKDFQDDVYLGETFGFAQPDSLMDPSEDGGPGETFGHAKSDFLKSQSEGADPGETFAFAQPDSPELRSEGADPGETSGFAQPDSPMDPSEDGGPGKTLGLPRSESLQYRVEDIYSGETFGLPRPDSLDSEEEADEEFYGYGSSPAQRYSLDESASGVMAYVQKHAVPQELHDVAVSKPTLDESSEAASTLSYTTASNPLPTAFTPFANVGSSVMEDLASLDMDPPVTSNPMPETNEMLIDFEDMTSLSGVGETAEDWQDALEVMELEEEIILGEKEEPLLDRLSKLATS